jgi:hypothetical protein
LLIEDSQKVARPKKEIKKKKKLTTHCTVSEALTINAKAKKCGLSTSVYLLKVGLEKKVEAKLSKDEIAIYLKLVGMANNVNQIAKRGNQTGMIDEQHLADLMKIRTLIMKLL